MSDEERKPQNLPPEGSIGDTQTSQKGIFVGVHAKELVHDGADRKPAIEKATEALCTQLNRSRDKFDKAEQDAWLKDLDTYAQQYERLIYSVISNYVYTLVKNDEKEYEIFESNLRAAYLSVAEARPPKDPAERETFLRKRSYATKFYDHVNLAQKQAALLKMKREEVAQIVDGQLKPALQEATDKFKAQMEADLNRTTKTFRDQMNTDLNNTTTTFRDQMNTDLNNTTTTFETQINNTTTEFKSKLDEMTTNLTSQLVSLVALFTALSFIVFGGISSLDSIFTVLSEKEHTVLPAIIVAIAWAFCMMNLLFLFVYFTLRIIAPQKDTKEKEEETPQKITFKALLQKYPLVFLSNYILLSLLLFTGGAYYAWITGIGRGIYDWVLSGSNLTFILGFALIAGIIFFSGRFLYRELTSPKPE